MATTIGKGNCRIMLFGDNLHTLGSPAIASAIDKTVSVDATQIKESTDIIFDDKVFKEVIKKSEQLEHILCKILASITEGLDEYEQKQVKGIKFVINSDLQPKKGYGYSAALSAAIANALNKLLTFEWHEEQVLLHVHNGEKAVHQNPTMLDTACAVEGSSIWFEKGKEGEKDTARAMKVGKTLFLVIANTDDTSDSSAISKTFEKWQKENPSDLKKALLNEKKILSNAKTALKFGEMNEIGKLMNQNQEILRTINATTPKLDSLVKIALEKGAYGAKVSSIGTESFAIALCENEAMQDKILLAIEQRGYKAIKAKAH